MRQVEALVFGMLASTHSPGAQQPLHNSTPELLFGNMLSNTERSDKQSS